MGATNNRPLFCLRCQIADSLPRLLLMASNEYFAMPSEETFTFNGCRIHRIQHPHAEALSLRLMQSLEKGEDAFTFSHRINDRWENTYLPIEKIPAAKEVIGFARDAAVRIYKQPLLALYEPVGSSPNPPFWFNLAGPGAITGVHDHSKEAFVSGVFYLKAPSNCGNLFFRADGEEDFVLEPVQGKIALFRSDLKHGVAENLSGEVRISLAFNIFSFPLSGIC